MELLSGLLIAKRLRQELKEQITDFRKVTGITPFLAVVTVGNDPASEIYVNKKIVAATEVGINSLVFKTEMPQLAYELQRLNLIPKVHGYILQLPLPQKVDPTMFFDYIDPLKDVDVFHPENVGFLVQHRPRFKPCTPHAVQILLKEYDISVAGKRVVIINRSNVVGKPLSSMLIQECDDYANATVTVCHDRTPAQTLKEIILQSDIVIVAVGKPNFLTADMVRSGQVIIDIGVSRIINSEGKTKIVGDTDFDNVAPKVKAITPAFGGIGPLTVTCLLQNVLKAASLQFSLSGKG
jgi:methylenetetrahydrofolate dehydrogenase (NADP+)/methenyltetrahydrofolate cyclohydrolase